MKNLILTLIITLPLTLWGQGWEQTYFSGGIIGSSIIENHNNNFLVTGINDSTNSGFIVKVNNQGNLISYTDINIYGSEIINTSDSCYVIAGDASFAYGVSIMKIDDNDNIIWNTSLNTLGNSSINQLESIQETNDGGFIFIAISDQKIALVKLDYFGNIVWSELIGDSGSYGLEVKQTQDSGFIVIG